MFRRRPDSRPRVELEVDGETVEAPEGESVAALLLALEGADYRRTGVSGAARAPFCMIGNCFDCLVEIDGVPNRQGCLVSVRAGMQVRRQGRAPA